MAGEVAVSRLLSSDIRTRQTTFSMKVDTSGLDSITDAVKIAIRDSISKGVEDLQAEVVNQIREQNLIKTGNLIGSVIGVMNVDGQTGYVMVGAFYGVYLEFGTSRMAPHPFFGPAVDAIQDNWIALVIENVREAMYGSS